jgi:hypothetical protein
MELATVKETVTETVTETVITKKTEDCNGDTKHSNKRVINQSESDDEQAYKKLCKAECDILEEIDSLLFPDQQLHFITKIMNANLPEQQAIKEIASKLADLSKGVCDTTDDTKSDGNIVSMTKIFEKYNPLEREYKMKILALFRSIVYRTFDMSKDFYNIDNGFVIFENIFKVKIYISKQDNTFDLDSYFQLMQSGLSHNSIMDTLEADKKIKKEFTIYFDFPFYITIKIDSQGDFICYRKQFDSLHNSIRFIDSVLYNASSTTYQCLDIILANNFISQITNKKFDKGIDYFTNLINLIQLYKFHGKSLPYTKNKIYFEEFYSIYKHSRININSIPIKNS